MSYIFRNIKWGVSPVSVGLSLLVHSIIFFALALIYSFQINKPVINTVYLTYQDNEKLMTNELSEEAESDEANQEELIKEEPVNAYFNNTEYDTSDIKQLYKESTLNVSVRYPNGWTYIDQNVKDKLDGVTFWSVSGNYEIPPYIHLEVQDKYIFNPSRYEHQTEYKGNIFYYNDPEIMEEFYTQIIYIRTDSDEDYSLKLMVKGKETFQSFQPVFFSMAKSFSFGKSFF
ncbi:MAG: hypothetical protein EHM47_11585 [Ignavibacteriales bacterium]|nr:MAG: hypothetical protein EHM47_11585 [Ignavibacteriales bacterium]